MVNVIMPGHYMPGMMISAYSQNVHAFVTISLSRYLKGWVQPHYRISLLGAGWFWDDVLLVMIAVFMTTDYDLNIDQKNSSFTFWLSYFCNKRVHQDSSAALPEAETDLESEEAVNLFLVENHGLVYDICKVN